METNQLQEKAQDVGKNLQSKAQEKFSDIKETAQDWQRRATETSRKAARVADEYVHENSWTVIASVAVAAVALGFILGRSRD